MQLEELFPYDSFRTGQRDLIESVYNTCKVRNKLVVEAMSGFGKTASVLCGTILAANEDDRRIIYACRTKRQVFRVMEEIENIQRKVPLKAVQLFAKTDYCLLKETSKFSVNQESFKWYCSFNTTNNLCSYFLNLSLVSKDVGRLVGELGEHAFKHTELLEKAREIHICPYEAVRIAMASSRVIVTTYHYFLDETARSVLLSSSGWKPSETIVIIDEAHNLRDFMRESCTIGLSFGDLDRAEQDATALNLKRTRAFLKELKEALRDSSQHAKAWYVDRHSLVKRIQQSHDEVWLPNLALELSTCAGIGWQTISTGRNLPTSIMKVGDFLKELVLSPEVGTTVVKSEDAFYLMKMSPSNQFRRLVSSYDNIILLSATVNPTDLFLKSIGMGDDTTIHRVLANQKFKVQTVLDTGTSTRFKMRSPSMYSKIASKIAAVCRSTEGSVGVFFPSYAMLESIRPLLSSALPNKMLIAEQRNLSNMEAEAIIDSFRSKQGSILLAVQGARFSEGEDFPGNQMDISIVVGLSLPPPSPKMYAEFADSEFNKHDTYLLVSLLPAVRKAIQSAGRHIRSPDKRGMVFFLDSRFAQSQLLGMMPKWLTGDVRRGDFQPAEIETMVRDFSTSVND